MVTARELPSFGPLLAMMKGNGYEPPLRPAKHEELLPV